MDATFGELKNKEVINIIDGARLGHVSDLVLDENYGRICGFIVPASTTLFGIFKAKTNSIYIPYNQVCKIGEDVILVELFVSSSKVRTLKSADSLQSPSINNQKTNISS